MATSTSAVVVQVLEVTRGTVGVQSAVVLHDFAISCTRVGTPVTVPLRVAPAERTIDAVVVSATAVLVSNPLRTRVAVLDAAVVVHVLEMAWR